MGKQVLILKFLIEQFRYYWYWRLNHSKSNENLKRLNTEKKMIRLKKMVLVKFNHFIKFKKFPEINLSIKLYD